MCASKNREYFLSRYFLPLRIGLCYVTDQGIIFFMINKWKSSGGELVELPAADQKILQSKLASVGEDVTKSNPSLNAFYKRVHATGKKY